MSASFNPLISCLSLPPVPAVQAWAKAWSGERGPLIDLSQAVPGYPPHPDLLAWLSEAAGSRAATGYGPIEGDPVLRQAYAAHVSELYGAEVGAENIHITAGCNQAFAAAALAVAGAGDRVLMTNPFYFNHETTLAMFGIGVDLVECRAENGFLPEPSEVEAALKTGVRAMALVTPNNPTGAVYPPDLLAEIFALCRRRTTWLILDETYRDFLPGGEPPHGLFSEPGWQDTLIGLYSFSKSYCIPGHRVGAVTAGPAAVAQIAKIVDNLQICAPRPPQAPLARAIPALAEWRAGNMHEIERRAAALREALHGLNGWHIEALGAYFAYVRHPFADRPSVEVAEQLAAKAGVLTIPGDFFGPGQQDYLRLAFANATAEVIRGLRARLEGFGIHD